MPTQLARWVGYTAKKEKKKRNISLRDARARAGRIPIDTGRTALGWGGLVHPYVLVTTLEKEKNKWKERCTLYAVYLLPSTLVASRRERGGYIIV